MAKHPKMLGKSLMDCPGFPSLLQTNSRSCPVHKQDFNHRPAVNFLSLLCFSVTFWVFLCPVFAAEITIVGKVNYSYQIMADDQIYEVANTAMGDDLVMNYIAHCRIGNLINLTIRHDLIGIIHLTDYSHFSCENRI